MSIEAIAWAFRVEGVTPTEKLVLLALANRQNPDNGICWPSVSRIARETCLSERSVTRTIKQLENRGLVLCERLPGKSTRYRLQVPQSVPTRAAPEQPTPDRVSPLPLTECHPTPDTVSGVPLTECHPKQKKKPKRTQSKKKTASDDIDPLAVSIDSTINPEAWRKWWEYKARGKKVYKGTVTAVSNQLKEISPEDQARAVDKAVGGTWRGLHTDAYTKLGIKPVASGQAATGFIEKHTNTDWRKGL